MTCVWFFGLRALLHLFQRLIPSASFKPDQGYLQTRPHVTVDPFNRSGEHFLAQLTSWDAALATQWSPSCLHSPEAFLAPRLLPSAQFVSSQRTLASRFHPVAANARRPPPAGRSPSQLPSTSAPSSDWQRPRTDDFLATQPPLELQVPAPAHKGQIVTIFTSAGARATVPRLLIDSESTMICFAFSVAAPHDVCNTAECLRNATRRNRTGRPTGPLCHINVSVEPWCSKPEVFWASLVTFLTLPGVAASIRPSAALRAKTPSVPWQLWQLNSDTLPSVPLLDLGEEHPSLRRFSSGIPAFSLFPCPPTFRHRLSSLARRHQHPSSPRHRQNAVSKTCPCCP